jgi:hypothetical protein
MLAYYHAGGDVAHPTVQFEYREIKETIRLEKEVLSESSYLDFFRSRGNRWRLAIIISLGIISQYSGNALFSNYINLIYEGAGITDSNQTLPVSVVSYLPTMFEELTCDTAQWRQYHPLSHRLCDCGTVHRSLRASPAVLDCHDGNASHVRRLDDLECCLRE